MGGSNANSWTVRGSNYGPPVPDAPTLPILHPAKILCRYPNVRLSVTLTAPLVPPRPLVRADKQYQLRHGMSNRFFPALTASSCGRRVQHGGGELLALLFSLTSRHRLARESTAPKFYVFAQLCLLVHHHNSLRPSSVNTTPGLSKVSHSQLRQLHADKIMTFRHPTIA